MPTVVGLSSLDEVHESVQVLSEAKSNKNDDSRRDLELKVMNIFKEAGYLGWSWESPQD